MRPFALTIAGHDPSGGAGLTADCKTFEQLNVQGLSVCTAVTVQTESLFESVNWVANELVIAQTNLLLNQYQPKVVKIGIIQSITLLEHLIEIIKKKAPAIAIIWDPVLSASAGFEFHNEKLSIEKLLSQITLLTPNRIEARDIFGTENEEELQKYISVQNTCNILLKGGHTVENRGNDLLISENEIHTIQGKNQDLLTDKHGTGCILSAAITASLANGNNLKEACTQAKRYVEYVMLSNKSLLAWHSK